MHVKCTHIVRQVLVLVLLELTVKMSDLASCGEVVCRAWDGCQNTQPKDITWNVMGMMNNPWFRIKVYLVPKMKWFEFWWQRLFITVAHASRSPR